MFVTSKIVVLNLYGLPPDVPIKSGVFYWHKFVYLSERTKFFHVCHFSIYFFLCALYLLTAKHFKYEHII